MGGGALDLDRFVARRRRGGIFGTMATTGGRRRHQCPNYKSEMDPKKASFALRIRDGNAVTPKNSLCMERKVPSASIRDPVD